MKKSVLGLICAVTVVGCLVSCGGEEKMPPTEPLVVKPLWVERGSGAFPGDVGKVIYGVGICAKDPNKALQRNAARNRARVELASVLNTYVAGLMKDFMESAKDFCDPSADSSIEYVQSVSKSVTDATLNFSEEKDTWTDPSDGTLYVLYAIPIDSVLNSMKDKAAELAKKARERQAEVFKGKTDDALKVLDQELEKVRTNQKS